MEVDTDEMVKRDHPVTHPPVDTPLCEQCQRLEMLFFDPNCPGCQDLLLNSETTIPQIFAIMRQWTPQTQQSFEMLIREILKRGGHVNDIDGLTDMTMLHYASKAGVNGIGNMEESCRMITLLLSQGANPFIRCRWTHMTALHYAVYFDIPAVVALLLQASQAIDVDLPCREFDGGTPLHIAAANLCCGAAEVLLRHRASVRRKDSLDRTPSDCIPSETSINEQSETLKTIKEMKRILEDRKDDMEIIPRYENIQGKVILQSLGFTLGERVVVAGAKTGILRYCGPTEFASGIWAGEILAIKMAIKIIFKGIELDDSAGKNDGSVAGISYFSCEPLHGIFAPVSKLATHDDAGVTNTIAPKNNNNAPVVVHHGRVDTSHVVSKINTGLRQVKENEERLKEGETVLVAGQRRGVIKYSGIAHFAPGWWYGIELERPVGKNDGSVNDRRYFTCRPRHGVFAPPSRVQRLTDSSNINITVECSPIVERQRRLSGGSSSVIGSGGSLNKNSGAKLSNPRLKSILRRTQSDRTLTSRPKSSSAVLRGTNTGKEFKLCEGMSCFCASELGIIRYIGTVEFADGVWLGVELRTAKGKNDGSVQGTRYFSCKTGHGLLVRPSKVTVRGINGAKLLSEAHQSLAQSATSEQ